MPSPIEIFPPEIFGNVIANLAMSDVSRLMQVSKPYRVLLEPLVWSKIEMHDLYYHHDRWPHKVLRSEEAAQRRQLLFSEVPKTFEPEKFLNKLSAHHTNGLSELRRNHLGSLITLLCLSIRIVNIGHEPYDIWNPFTNFVNLEYLELSSAWTPRENLVPFAVPKHALTKLRTLKLRGHMPFEFLQWLFKEPGQIEELQLGLLNFPIIGWLNYGFEEIEKYITSHLRDDEDEDPEELYHEIVAPRPLACLSTHTVSLFKKLTKLYLYKPASPFDHIDLDLYFCEKSEKRILAEWRDLIRATRNTLEYIIFDQRPVAHHTEPEGTSNAEYMNMVAEGESYELFEEIVLPTLLENEQFPALKIIRLFGFERHDFEHDEGELCAPESEREEPRVHARLQAAFPEAEITDHAGRRIIVNADTGDICWSEYKPWLKPTKTFDLLYKQHH